MLLVKVMKYVRRISYSREVSCGFLVFRLLFCEKSSQGYDVCIDLLLGDWGHFAIGIVRGHSRTDEM